jgi:phosphoglycolate phosphatase-like HAD superfamily hydrolase
MIEKGAIKILIFDFDGVIVESNGIKDEAFRQLFSRFPDQLEEMMNYHKEHVSASRVFKFNYLLSLLGKTDDEVLHKQLMVDFSGITLNLMKQVPLVFGATAFLNNWPQIPKYLASVTPIDDLVSILENLGLTHYFKGVYGCPPWTKPNAIRDILSQEKINSSEALLIGDSAGDQRSAKETGIHFLARNSGLAFDKPLPLSFPDLHTLELYCKENIL